MVTVRTTTKTEDTDPWKQSVDIDVLVDGERITGLSFSDGEPEDNIIARNFSGVCFLNRVVEVIVKKIKEGHAVEFEDIGE